MFICLEGVDGGGKSTLADAVEREILRQHPDHTVVRLHASQLKRPPIEEYVLSVADYVPGSTQHIIADRWHYGEEIYGPLYRGKSAMSTAEWRWIEHWLGSRGARFWVISQSLERVRARLLARGEDYLQPEHVAHVLTQFDAIGSRASTYAGTFQPEGDTAEIVEHIIIDAAHAEGRAAYMRSMLTSYVGRTYTDPHTLLVGDKRGGSSPHVTDGAFYPVNGNSAVFLWNALPDSQHTKAPWWHGVAVINANEEDQLELALDRLSETNVVALGKEAKTKLAALNVAPFSVMPHPQYVRRFYHDKQLQYGSEIRNVASIANTGKDLSTWPK